MEKVSVETARAIEGGKKYTATARCGSCGKRFSASANYYGWISYASAKFSAQNAVRNKLNNHIYSGHL